MVRPTENGVKKWIFEVCNHSLSVVYFCERLQAGMEDPQWPHDIIGKGNKLEWDVIKGFALQYRYPTMKTSSNFFKENIEPSLDLHRKCQYHHQMWNQPNKKATEDSNKVGAVDAVCSLLEDRKYQGGSHTYEQILEIAEEDPPHQKESMIYITTEMRKIKQPKFPKIEKLDEKSLLLFSNPGISSEVYETIQERISETLQMLRKNHGYKLK